MSGIEVKQHKKGITVRTNDWVVEHSAERGGAWTSVILNNGTGRNLLRKPLSSVIRFHKVDGSEYGLFPTYTEANETRPNLRLERTRDGFPIIVAEGAYKDEKGNPIPVGYRRRTEYHDFGLVWSTLEIMSDIGCDGVVHVRAFEAQLRDGLTDLYVREHPATAPNVDLLGGTHWYDLPRSGNATPFYSRYAPIHVICFERGVEGIEFFPGSELAQWDCNIKPEPGHGLYVVSQSPEGTNVEFDPYCVAFRRVKIKLQGVQTYRMGIGLPSLKPRRHVHTGPFHAGTWSEWASDADIEKLAKAGVKLLRFHCDYRENGPFWHDGMYPPFDAAGMKELRRVIDTAHKFGMKIVPYISLKEFHPISPGFAENAYAWMHMASPFLDMIHTWIRSGEFGGVMCMRSAWLEFRKRSIDIILSDLPWDGLYFDWCTAHPCRHPGHGRGPYHTDIEECLDFLLYCRKRVGERGILFMHLSGLPSIVMENMADLAFIHEDQGGVFPLPGRFPPQCDFMPITPRQLVGGAAPGTEECRRFIMGGLLDGFPACTSVPIKDFGEEMLAEMELFAGHNLLELEFYKASDYSVQTGHPDVFGAAWVGPDKLLIYVGNLSNAPREGKLKFADAKEWFEGEISFQVEERTPKEKAVPKGQVTLAQLTGGQDMQYSLAPWSSCLYVLSRR